MFYIGINFVIKMQLTVIKKFHNSSDMEWNLAWLQGEQACDYGTVWLLTEMV